MSKAQRNRQQSARERIAAQQAAAKRAETRRRALLAGGATLAVIIIVVVLVVIKANQNSGNSTKASDTSVTGAALPASVTSDVTTVPAATLDKVGGGSVLSYNTKPVTAISGPPLTSAGKPEMLYIGAEFCPYC